MLTSMTAFTRAEKNTESLSVLMEIRAFNSKGLDISIRIPSAYQVLEERIRGRVSRRVSRGRIEISCQVTPQEVDDTECYDVNMAKARAYHNALDKLRDALDLSGAITLELLMSTGNIIRPAERQRDMDADWQVIGDCLDGALEDLCAMRSTEGAHLAKDLSGRLQTVAESLALIETATSGLLERYRQRLTERIAALTRGLVEIDAARISQEAALLADRSDISEEIIRARSHIQQFRSIMDREEAAGRKLNFLLQELNREFNTMGSKAGNAEISHTIVEVKSELEKMREQVQNVE
jgi:uncharacterized protein (TIGR00255 family)